MFYTCLSTSPMPGNISYSRPFVSMFRTLPPCVMGGFWDFFFLRLVDRLPWCLCDYDQHFLFLVFIGGLQLLCGLKGMVDCTDCVFLFFIWGNMFFCHASNGATV